jgi:hypothetical protein
MTAAIGCSRPVHIGIVSSENALVLRPWNRDMVLRQQEQVGVGKILFYGS